MPVRACIDANGSPAFRWGRKGKVFPYGHGIGITKTQAFDLAARHGRVTRLRQLQQEDWARGMKLDAKSRGPFRGRVPLFSDRAAQAHEELLGSQLALTLRLLKQYGGADIKAAQADLTERRTDADPASYFRLLSVIRAIRASVGASAEGAADGLRFIGEEVDEDATETTDKQLSRLFTIPLATAAGSQAAVDGFVEQNIGLIKSLTGTALDEVEEMVVGAMTGGTPTLDLAKAIEERFGVAWSRASLIARDQTAKLASQIAQSQQELYGITKYMWSTSGDARVRQEHADLDGSIQKWAEPPVADKAGKRGHPGELWQCRCTASPVLDDEDEAMLRAQAVARQQSELLTMQASPTVQGEIPNYSKFSDWNAKRIAAIKAGDPTSVGLPA